MIFGTALLLQWMGILPHPNLPEETLEAHQSILNSLNSREQVEKGPVKKNHQLAILKKP